MMVLVAALSARYINELNSLTRVARLMEQLEEEESSKRECQRTLLKFVGKNVSRSHTLNGCEALWISLGLT